MKFSELNLKKNANVTTINVNDKEIQVLQYLPIEDKNDLIEIVLQKSFDRGICNEMKLDMYFYLYLVYMYTNLEFTDDEKADEAELYDLLNSNDVLFEIIGAIDDEEYETLVNYLQEMRNNYEEYYRSTASLLQSFIEDMPANAEAAKEIVDNFDKEKFKEVVDFAQYANGGRPI